MCYSPALRQDRVTGPGWGRDGKANGEDFLQEEEEGSPPFFFDSTIGHVGS